MADPNVPADDDAEVFDRVDSLMSRHRPAGAAPATPVVPVAPPPGDIPVLTDVVSLGPPTARRTPEPAAPHAATTTDVRAMPADIDALEQEVYRRLVDRFDREVAGIIERRVMPELAGSLDFALSQIAAELKGSLRQLVRETIEETLQRQMRNHRLPLDTPTNATPHD